MRSVPSLPIPMLLRSSSGGLSRAPERSRIPVGIPLRGVKKSPLTPAAVVAALTVFSAAVTSPRPGKPLCVSSGTNLYSPPGFGVVITFKTTGPCEVSRTCC